MKRPLASAGGSWGNRPRWTAAITPLLCLGLSLAGAGAADAANCSGPDAFGYTCEDSNSPSGPGFHWVELSGTGTPIPLTDEGHQYPIGLPFAFEFYGESYTQIAVGANGGVYFEDNSLLPDNTELPSASAGISTFIAAYWDDLEPGSGGEVFYEVTGTPGNRAMVVEWKDVPHDGPSPGTLTMEVLLLEDSNNVLVQYLDPSTEAGSGATEGLQDQATALQYAYNEEGALEPDLAICYMPPGSSDPGCLEYTPEPGGALLGLTALGVLGWLRKISRVPPIRGHREPG
jgi:hypothetical protein